MQKSHRIVLFIAFALGASPAIAQTLPEFSTFQKVKKNYKIQEDTRNLTCHDTFAASFQTAIENVSAVVVDKNDNEDHIEENIELDKNENDKLREALNLQPDTDVDESENGLEIVTIETKNLSNRTYRFYLENSQFWDQADTASRKTH